MQVLKCLKMALQILNEEAAAHFLDPKDTHNAFWHLVTTQVRLKSQISGVACV